MFCTFDFNASGVIYLLRNYHHTLCQAILGGNLSKDLTFSRHNLKVFTKTDQHTTLRYCTLLNLY